MTAARRRFPFSRLGVAGVALAALLAAPVGAQDAGPTQLPVVRIGVVLDGPWDRNAGIEALFQREITVLNRNDFDIVFPDEYRVVGDWTAEAVAAALDRLLAEPEVDLVYAMGVLASAEAVHRRDLAKPVIAPFLISPELQGLDPAAERSGISNLTYVAPVWSAESALTTLQRLTGFVRVAFLADAKLLAATPLLGRRIQDIAAATGYELQVIPVGSEVAPALAAIEPDVDAVMVGALLNLPDAEFDRLVRGLIERRLPSMSLLGRSEVERGLLFGIFPDTDFQRVARRVAIDTQAILLGRPAARLDVQFAQAEQLVMNRATARAIGYSPSWDTLTEAEILEDRRTDVDVDISLAEAVQQAVDANLDYLASARAVAAGEDRVREARSPLLPQLDVSGTGVSIDADRAAASFGQQSQRTLSASLGFTQVLYSDAAWTGWQTQELLQQATVLEREQLRLDIVLDAAVAYLEVLRASVLEEVEQQNLALSRSNLDLAQTRLDVGTSSRADVFRWQAEIATDRRRVIDASAIRNLAEIELNRLRDRPLEEPFRAADPRLTVAEGGVVDELRPYISDVESFRLFRDFMAAEGLREAPELRTLDAAIAVQRRVLTSTRRSFWLPTAVFQGTLTRVLARGGAGADADGPGFPLPGGDAGDGLFEPVDTTWTAAFNATLPLYQGSGRYARRERAFEELQGLRIQRRAVAERVEQRVRSSLHLMGASYASIELARQAEEAARNNLRLVQDAYSQGVVDIIVLLDAQNAALLAELAAATAVYDFYVDLVSVGRSIARFDFLMPSPGRQEWLDRLRNHFENARGPR